MTIFACIRYHSIPLRLIFGECFAESQRIVLRWLLVEKSHLVAETSGTIGRTVTIWRMNFQNASNFILNSFTCIHAFQNIHKMFLLPRVWAFSWTRATWRRPNITRSLQTTSSACLSSRRRLCLWLIGG